MPVIDTDYTDSRYVHAKLLAWSPENDQDWLDAFKTKHGLTDEMGPPKAWDDKERPYIVFDMGGTRKEGDVSLMLITDKHEFVHFALDTLGQHILKWLGERKHIIWRTKPQARVDYQRIEDPFRSYTQTVVRVYARLQAD